MQTEVKDRPRFHTPKDAVWINAVGDEFPKRLLTNADKVREASASKIFKAALAAEKSLNDLWHLMDSIDTYVREAIRKEYELRNGKEAKEGKGGFTWHNFDKSVKIEADINEILKWDDASMTEALQLFEDYLSETMSGATDGHAIVSELLKKALSKSSKMIDSKKVFQILMFEPKIRHNKFQRACQIIKQAQSIDRTKLYRRVWVRQTDGSYRNINLNFSSL